MDYKNINDYEVLYMIRENSEDARDLIFEKYSPIIKSLASKYYLNNKDLGADYEDYHQEALIAFNRAVVTYDECRGTLFYTYAPAVINRHLVTFVRNLKMKKHHILNKSLRSNQVLNNFQEDTDIFINKLLEKELVNFMNTLDFECSNIFELRYNGFSYREISILLDVPITTIQSRINKIRRTLRRKFIKTI